MMKTRSCLFFLSLMSLGFAAPDVNNLLDSAKTQYKNGEIRAALESVDQAKLMLFQAAPLALENFQLVKEPSTAYGVYQTRESNVFKTGDTIYIYCEPIGYTIKEEGENYNFKLTTDFSISDDKNNVLARQEDFANFGLDSHEPNTELMLNINYKFTGAEPGTYFLQTTVRDQYSDKRTSKTIVVKFE
ncbi:MAG: hypothetical protein JHC93_07015 [Parachlamydiales bacterium]|nr:hypothetical protein [Parachlamydiales bacterium]